MTELRAVAERTATKTSSPHQHQAQSLQALTFALEEVEASLTGLSALVTQTPQAESAVA